MKGDFFNLIFNFFMRRDAGLTCVCIIRDSLLYGDFQGVGLPPDLAGGFIGGGGEWG